MRNVLKAAFCSSAVLVGMVFGQATPPTSGTVPPAGAAGGNQPQGQSSAMQPASAPASPVQSGSIIYAELSKSVDAKKAKSGDEIQAKATQAVLSQGKVVIPKGSKIIGHVTQATPRTGDQQPSQLGILFDHAVLKDGTQVPLSISVQALGGGMNAQSMMNQPSSMGSIDANRGMSSSGMPGRTASAEGGGYGTPGGGAPGMGPGGGTATDVGVSSESPGANVHLNAGSRGVVGLTGLSMTTGPQGTVITSEKKNVKLDSGIELVLRAN